jgi:hypothetical protein
MASTPDKYRITELIPTDKKNEVYARLKFTGTWQQDPFNSVDAAMNAELAEGAAVFQTINDHLRLSIRSETVACLLPAMS